ncbi:hypothetical protein SNEBB_003644, partial [Seison nebaliae]
MKGSLDRNTIPKSIRILDVLWSPDSKVNMKDEFKQKHIPKSQHFDLFAAARTCRLYTKSFPLATDFESYTKFQMGLNRDDHVVVYDRSSYGFHTAPKAFWTCPERRLIPRLTLNAFKILRHENVSLLNGGLFGWMKKGGKIENGEGYSMKNGSWKFNPKTGTVWRRNCQQILNTIHHHDEIRKEIVVDIRNRKAFDHQYIKHSINSSMDERKIDVKGNYIASSMKGMSATSLS